MSFRSQLKSRLSELLSTAVDDHGPLDARQWKLQVELAINNQLSASSGSPTSDFRWTSLSPASKTYLRAWHDDMASEAGQATLDETEGHVEAKRRNDILRRGGKRGRNAQHEAENAIDEGRAPPAQPDYEHSASEADENEAEVAPRAAARPVARPVARPAAAAARPAAAAAAPARPAAAALAASPAKAAGSNRGGSNRGGRGGRGG